MAVPRAVQAAADKADKILREGVKQPAVADTVQPITNPSVETQPVQSKDQPAPAIKTPDIDYKARYLALQGKYDAEVPRLSGQLRDLGAENKTLESRVNSLESENKPINSTLTIPENIQAVMDEHGEPEFWKWIVSNMGASNNVNTSDTETRLLNIEKTQANIGKSSFESELSRLVPDWVALNNDNEFGTWLNAFDPLRRATRREQLESAFYDGNAPLVATFFTDWIAETGVQSKPDINTQIQPGAHGAGEPMNNKPRYTRADLKKYEQDCITGRFKGRDEERLRLDKEYHQAQMEGRIDG